MLTALLEFSVIMILMVDITCIPQERNVKLHEALLQTVKIPSKENDSKTITSRAQCTLKKKIII